VCGKRCVPPPDLAGAVVGRRRLRHGLTRLIAVLREAARLPDATIQPLLETVTGLHRSVGALVDAVGRVARQAAPLIAQVQDAIRTSPVGHADETGWREAGHNGDVWTFSTPDHRLFQHGRRTRAMVAQARGDVCAGIVVSDFYAASTNDDRVHQYWWAHLQRDIHELTDQQPLDASVQGWATAVQAIVPWARAGATGPPPGRRQIRQQVEAELRTLCRSWQEPKVPQTPLCNRMLRSLESLFGFVTKPAVPATNNAAERSVRPLVVSRKISGGTRSAGAPP